MAARGSWAYWRGARPTQASTGEQKGCAAARQHCNGGVAGALRCGLVSLPHLPPCPLPRRMFIYRDDELLGILTE